MLKKYIAIITIIVLIVTFNIISFADDENEDLDFTWIEEEILNVSSKPTDEPKIYSKAAVIIDRNSKQIIFGKNENDKVPMASTTKIMSAIILLEAMGDNLNKEVEVCKQAANIRGSRLGLKTNDIVTLNDLLYGLMLCSGNDAAVQIAVSVAGSTEKFAELMNTKAKQLGLKHTHFITPHGLDEDEHYTTAYELAKITDYALQNEKLKEVVGTKTHTILINNNAKEISNTNELLGYLDGVYGVKTGFTNKAGRCLVSAINREGLDIICVVLGADTKKTRTRDSVSLIEYVYKNYTVINLKQIIKEEFESWKLVNKKIIYVNKGEKENVELKLEENKYNLYSIKNNNLNNVKIEINSIDYLNAPVEKNTIIGTLKILIENKEVGNIKILTSEKIKKKNIIDYFIIILKMSNGFKIINN